jgi:O-Antigen ligase
MDANGGGNAQLSAPRPADLGVRAQAALRAAGPWLAQAGLPFLLIAYLGLREGGYDDIVRGEMGVAVWWIVLLGAAVGALPVGRLGRGAWVALGLLAAFAAWTAIGISWSESAERSMAEVGRVAALLGVYVLAVSVQGGDGLRRTVGGVAAGIALIGSIALLSRLQPSWFPALDTPQFLPESEARLHYPLAYWNGLGAFCAIGIPLLLALATAARHLLARALAVAAVPVLALAMFFTLSRGATLVVVVALLVLLALHPRRLALAAYGAVAAAGSAVLVFAADQRGELVDGLLTGTAGSQGDEMLAMTIVVCLGIGLIATAVALADRHGIVARPTVPRRTPAILAGLALAAVVAAIVAGVPGELSDAWEDFKEPTVPTAASERFDSTGGSGRYQFWETALEANSTDPLIGIGAGTYEYFWAREGTLPTFVRDAHSLYFETLAELGIVGLVLVLGVVASPFVIGIRRRRALGPSQRALLAGALAGCAAFAIAAGIDWAWELTVLPVTFLLLAAAAIGRPEDEAANAAEPGRQLRSRAVFGVLAVAGIVVVAIPMVGVDAVRDSQANVRSQDLSAALGDARSAEDIEPYAATPALQQALVLELQGDLDGAIEAAKTATRAEPTNWRTWLTASRLAALSGDYEGAILAYRFARELNPRSALFE